MPSDPAKPRIIVRRVSVVVASLLLVLGITLWIQNKPGRRPPLPVPNGYDDYLMAVKTVTGDRELFRKPDGTFPGIEELTEKQLTLLVSTNRQVIDMVVAALDKEWAVSDDPDHAIEAYGMDSLRVSWDISRAIEARARLLVMQGRTQVAMENIFHIIEFGQKLGRRGSLIHGLVATPQTQRGFTLLSDLIAQLDEAQCVEAMMRLRASVADDLVVDEIIEGERRYIREHGGLHDKLQFMWENRTLSPSNFYQKDFQTLMNRLTTQRNLTLLQLAARAYELRHGGKPNSVEVLVPEFLPAVPVDSANGNPLTLEDLPQAGR